MQPGKIPTLYHGTGKDFAKLRPNWLGILWLDPNPVVATEYALPYYRDRGYVWKVTLAPNANIAALNDLKAPAIRALFEAANEQQRARGVTGEWSEEDWRRRADFGILETYRWAARFLKERKLDGIVVSDSIGTTGVKHTSPALLRPTRILSMEKTLVERDPSQKKETIGDLAARVAAHPS